MNMIKNQQPNKERAWKKKFKQFREVGKLRISNMSSKDQPLSVILEEFIEIAYQEGRRDGMGKSMPSSLSDELPETMIWNIDHREEILNPPRKKSTFVQEILHLHLEKYPDGAIYVSHKEWLETYGGNKLSLAGQKNGPKNILKRYNIACWTGTITNPEELKLIADAEGRELTEKDIIYRLYYKKT